MNTSEHKWHMNFHLHLPKSSLTGARSARPRIARAEDLVVGAGRVAKDAMKDTAWGHGATGPEPQLFWADFKGGL